MIASRQSGIALVSVLWLLLLLSGLAATVAYVARINALITRSDLDSARAQAAADAAVIHAISGLSDEELSRRPSVSEPTNWEFDQIKTTTEISSEGGRIDLNAASDEVIRTFLLSQGMSTQSAMTLIGQLRSRQGDPSAPAAIRANPLKTLEELNQLPAWHGRISCWRRSLTVYSGQVEPTHSILLANRSLVGEVLRVRSSSTVGLSAATSEWVGRLTGDQAKPMLTLAWSHEIAFENDGDCAAQIDGA